jgi:hypothetical protein
MMTFRELIIFWEKLQQQSSVDIKNSTIHQLLEIMHSATKCAGAVDTELLDIKYQHIQTAFDHFEQTLDELKVQVKKLLTEQEPEWLERSLVGYKESLRLKMSQHPDFLIQHRNQRTCISKPIEDLFVARLMRHSDWHYPAMIIHPGAEPFMQHLVGSDPLYIVDESDLLIDQLVMKNYNPVYQRRLRPYVIEESFEHEILEQLPNNQFGLCFAYNYFNFRPVEMIGKYLKEIYQKLSPGGQLIMTFNNCDHPGPFDLVMRNYACYATSEIIKKLGLDANYEIDFFCDHPPDGLTWIEFRKPGSLSSNRGGQTMAKIVPIIKHPNAVANDQ